MEQILTKLCLIYREKVTMYFNKKYKRVGHVFQDITKSQMIDLIQELLKISNCSQRYTAKVLGVSKEKVRKELMGNAPKEPSP
jgi:predicted XRE-type DNA-binding protein